MLMRLQQGRGEIFEKLREVIRKEAATERRREKCKGMDTHTHTHTHTHKHTHKDVKALQKF